MIHWPNMNCCFSLVELIFQYLSFNVLINTSQNFSVGVGWFNHVSRGLVFSGVENLITSGSNSFPFVLQSFNIYIYNSDGYFACVNLFSSEWTLFSIRIESFNCWGSTRKRLTDFICTLYYYYSWIRLSVHTLLRYFTFH